MVDSDTMLSAGDEIDLSADGIQEKELEFTISSFERETTDRGDERAILTFHNDELPFAVTVREWLKHSNPKAQEIGRGNLKKIAQAATGQPKLSASLVIGSKLLATTADNGNGFTTLKKFKSIPAAA